METLDEQSRCIALKNRENTLIEVEREREFGQKAATEVQRQTFSVGGQF